MSLSEFMEGVVSAAGALCGLLLAFALIAVVCGLPIALTIAAIRWLWVTASPS